MRSALFVLAVLAAPAVVHADYTETVVLEVGQTVQKPVGFAIGHICDDTSVVQSEMQNGPSGNVLVLTGLKPGATLCRAGVGQSRPSTLFQVTVLERGQ